MRKSKKISRELLAATLGAAVLWMTACGTVVSDVATTPENGETTVAAEEVAAETEGTATEAVETVESGDTAPASDAVQQASTDEQDQEIPALRDCVEQKMGCRIGCAVTGSEPWKSKLWDLVTTHFNAITLGNELKPDSLFGYSNSVCPGTEEAELNGERMRGSQEADSDPKPVKALAEPAKAPAGKAA